MAKPLLVVLLALGLTNGAAGTHTLVVLSHNDHTAYEIDPMSGKILRSFKAINQPHEGVVSADGKTVFVAVPNGPVVSILDGATFKELSRIETPLFRTKTVGVKPVQGTFGLPDGKIMVGGSGRNTSGFDAFLLARLNANGTPDDGFDGDGFLVSNQGPAIPGMVRESGGHLVVTGWPQAVMRASARTSRVKLSRRCRSFMASLSMAMPANSRMMSFDFSPAFAATESVTTSRMTKPWRERSERDGDIVCPVTKDGKIQRVTAEFRLR